MATADALRQRAAQFRARAEQEQDPEFARLFRSMAEAFDLAAAAKEARERGEEDGKEENGEE